MKIKNINYIYYVYNNRLVYLFDKGFLKQFIHLLDKFVCEVMQQEIFLNCNISPAYKNHSLPNTNIIL